MTSELGAMRIDSARRSGRGRDPPLAAFLLMPFRSYYNLVMVALRVFMLNVPSEVFTLYTPSL